MALAACLAGVCRADTIVLKNGRRIVVSNVTREAGKVSGDTPAGRVSLPESMVAQRGKGWTPRRSAPGNEDESLGGRSADRSSFGRAPAERFRSSRSAVVHDGAIDREALARFDSEAPSGNAEAVARAVAGESAASQFEFGRGDIEQALAHAERGALPCAGQVTLLLNAAYLHLRRSEYSAASDLLDRARRLAPDSPDVAKLSGWADYGLNQLPQAVEEWKRAQQLRPDPEVASALDEGRAGCPSRDQFRGRRKRAFCSAL